MGKIFILYVFNLYKPQKSFKQLKMQLRLQSYTAQIITDELYSDGYLQLVVTIACHC